ncbi:hypothetical protein [Bdellovibrio bacteriovorus]|uniref:hypothetical protein n=1 Tax=Bdellovibrio bacteriovorus TaxID=959 RepID=UPI003AA8093D
MKSKSILYTLISLSLAACAPTADELADIKKSHSGPKIGISGLVVVRHAAVNRRSPDLPKQISVEFERESSPGSHLILTGSLVHLRNFSANEGIVSFGCHEDTDIAKLPAKLTVDTLKICGKHKIENTSIVINAKTVIMDNATLDFIPHKALQLEEQIEFISEEFLIEGENNITLQGAATAGGRDLAPTLFLDTGPVSGAGHLKVYSKASIYTVKL